MKFIKKKGSNFIIFILLINADTDKPLYYYKKLKSVNNGKTLIMYEVPGHIRKSHRKLSIKMWQKSHVNNIMSDKNALRA